MDMSLSDSDRLRSGGNASRKEAGEALKALKGAGGQEARDLLADVQDLLGRVAHVADPDIARLRAKLEADLQLMQQSLAEGVDTVQGAGRDAMRTGDTYVRDRPWQAVGVAAVAGLLVGFLVGRH